MEKNHDMPPQPYIAKVKDFRIDSDYATWLSDIKRRYLSAQIKTVEF